MPQALTYPGVYIEELPSAVRLRSPRSWLGAAGLRFGSGPGPELDGLCARVWRTGLAQLSLGYAVNQFFANGGQ